jgi:RimJ/RimL family protein N-acetyltransferase
LFVIVVQNIQKSVIIGLKYLYIRLGDGVMISGDKVLIRAVETGDLQYYNIWSGDLELMELFSFVIDFSIHNESRGRYEPNDGLLSTINFTIVEKDGRKPIGKCSIEEIDYVNKKCTCRMYIGDKNSRDKGYGTESMKLLMEYAFNDLNLNRMGLWVFDFNKRAMRCFKKCGFKVEGIMREGLYRDGRYHDVYFMGILRDEYEEMLKRGDDGCLEENM